MFDDFTTEIQSDEIASLRPDWAELWEKDLAAELYDD